MNEQTTDTLNRVACDKTQERREVALSQLKEQVSKGETIHCMIDPTRSGAGAWVRIFALGMPRGSEPWPIDITYAVGHATSLQLYQYHGQYLVYVRGGGFNRADHIADQIANALGWLEGEVKGHAL